MMKLQLVTGNNEKVPLMGNPWFDITDFDGFTQGDVSMSVSNLANADGDVLTAQYVNARDVTLTLHFKDMIRPEQAKRYLLQYFKLKKEVTIELDYQDRTSRLTGTVQSIEIPRFALGIRAQISIHCSNPFWQDINEIAMAISNVIAMHHWPINPTAEEPIFMGFITDAYQTTIVNNGDVEVGMVITITADVGDEETVSNPRIMIDRTALFFEVAVDMKKNDELVINTNRGQKSVRLNGENVINKIVTGSTWLQLEVGSNTIVCTNSLGGTGMVYNVSANERYL